MEGRITRLRSSNISAFGDTASTCHRLAGVPLVEFPPRCYDNRERSVRVKRGDEDDRNTPPSLPDSEPNREHDGTRRIAMTIFDRYVFRQTALATLLILGSLCGVVWIALALKQLKLVTSNGQDMVTLLSMTTLALPNMMALVAPVALLIASIHTLNRLNGDSELIVLTASGATIWRVAKPLLILALLVSLFVAFINHFGMPWSLRILRTQIQEMRSDLLSQVLQPGRFSSPTAGVTVHVRDRARDGTLLGILIQDARKANEFMTYLAESGKIVKSGSTSYLTMQNGHVIRRNMTAEGRNAPPEILRFASYAVDLDQFEAKSATHEWKPRERYFSELAWPNTKSRGYAADKGHIRAELHERFASPLYPFVFVLIAVAFIGQAQSTRANQTRSTALAFMVAVGFRLGGLGVNNAVTLDASAVPLLYALPLGGIALGLALLLAGNRQRRGPGWFDRIENAVLAAIGRLPLPRFGRRHVEAGE